MPNSIAIALPSYRNRITKCMANKRTKGDPSALFVYRFRSQNQPYLLGHTVDAAVHLVYLEAVGPQENFYRDPERP